MRKGFAIFLLLVLGCPYWGTRAFLLHRKEEVREMVKNRILAGVGENEMVRLSFTAHATKTQLRWEHSKEFEYKGEMYDIVKSEEEGDSIIYWCIWDKAETQINRQLEILVAKASGSDPQHKKCLESIFSFLKSLFYHPSIAPDPSTASTNKTLYFYRSFANSIPDIPPVPPPEV